MVPCSKKQWKHSEPSIKAQQVYDRSKMKVELTRFVQAEVSNTVGLFLKPVLDLFN